MSPRRWPATRLPSPCSRSACPVLSPDGQPPRPSSPLSTCERVSRPLMPSFSYRFSHLLTVCCSISVLSPILATDIPSTFKSTARQRILKQCFSPWRYPHSSSRRCASLNSNRVVTLIFIQCDIHRANVIY